MPKGCKNPIDYTRYTVYCAKNDRRCQAKSAHSWIFKDVFCELHGGDILWAMASAGGYSYNFSFSTLDEALKGFTALLNYDVNLYYSPAIFKGYVKTKMSAASMSSIYRYWWCEGVDFSEMDEKGSRTIFTAPYHLTSLCFRTGWFRVGMATPILIVNTLTENEGFKVVSIIHRLSYYPISEPI